MSNHADPDPESQSATIKWSVTHLVDLMTPDVRWTGVGEDAVGQVVVVVIDEVDDQALQLVPVPADGAVEQFVAHGSAPVFSERVGAGRSDRGFSAGVVDIDRPVAAGELSNTAD